MVNPVGRARKARLRVARTKSSRSATSERRSHLKANAKHSSGRSDRSAAKEPRSGLTATGRCGRRGDERYANAAALPGRTREAQPLAAKCPSGDFMRNYRVF
jgi:hypothetical protein